jgi:beta-1,4-N-acetylglucosaminyltransferase
MLVSALDFSRYTPRTYIISEGDSLSAQKSMTLESLKAADLLPSKVCTPGIPGHILADPKSFRVQMYPTTIPF